MMVARALRAAGGVGASRRVVRIEAGAAGRRLVGPAAAAGLLGIARLLPETGFGLWVRLAAGTAIVLLPGYLVARALGRRSSAATFAWSLAVFGGGLALAFSLGASLDVALAFDLAVGATALGVLMGDRSVQAPAVPVRERLARWPVGIAGAALGAALWFVEGPVSGDGLFHLGRIRKLAALSSLSLHDVGEFYRGGLDSGYAFPLWHGWLALVARLAGVDPTAVVRHESSLLAPLALILIFEMGFAVFRSLRIAFAVLLAAVALDALAPGHAGTYAWLWEPATVAHVMLVPATVTLFFALARTPTWPVGLTLAVGAASLGLIHSTYALFVAIPLIAFVVVRMLFTRFAEWRECGAALAALVLPLALVYAWLRPVVEENVALHLGPKALQSSLVHYGHDLTVQSLGRYSVVPQLAARNGPVAVAALVLTPLALLAWRRRWSALVLGGTVALLSLDLWPLVFPHFANLVSISQGRRALAFIPFEFAFAGGLTLLARFSRLLTLAAGLGAGIWLQLAYPGDFAVRRLPHPGPGLPAWIALYGGAAAIVAGALFALSRREWLQLGRMRGETTAALAALLFVVPAAVHGFSHWAPKKPHDPNALTPGLVRFLQQDVPARSVVFTDLETSYRAVAFAPVYAVAMPPSHVSNTKPNRVHQRRHAVLTFLSHPDLAIPLRWHAGWLVLRRGKDVADVEGKGLRPAYSDPHFVVFKLPGAKYRSAG